MHQPASSDITRHRIIPQNTPEEVTEKISRHPPQKSAAKAALHSITKMACGIFIT
ncbi:MAG: hypothetical protein QF692_00240 [Alphaproteobacteria bacterium]|jgi:hypothetical protein|nr:hypothetical protein [Alphaproteobacteria bacterium]MDP7221675.1 hypothetical protein [Alphaproteobacteria bacterium]